MLDKSDIEYIQTADGSDTLLHKKLNVMYKSEHGAQQESLHIFIEGCQLQEIPKEWHVLELGFGTGRNFLNTFVLAEQLGVKLHYEALEWEPIPPEYIAQVPKSDIGQKIAKQALQQIRKEKKRTEVSFIKQSHKLILHPFSFQQTLVPRHFFHALFHDPFAPSVNSESWSVEYFKWAYGVLRKDGVLATYSSAGHVRRALAEAGFYVGVIKGPGKKKEITLASAREDRITHCKIKNRPI